MISGKNRKRRFQKNNLTESLEDIKNPGRGWYHLYTYDLAERIPELYIACREETVVLLLIHIGQFRNCRISGGGLDYLTEILEFFKEHEKMMILRFAYDTDGRGMESEPDRGEQVKEHMDQIGTKIKDYADDILAVQGLLVGNWGEMHGSKFLSDKWLTELAGTYMKAMDYSCCLAVRTPKQWKTIMKHPDEKMRSRLVLFNDGIFGSDTDLGTYTGPEDRKKKLEWIEKEITYGPSGGEAVYGQNDGEEKDPCSVIADLRKMHLTYLNSTYDKRLLDRWKEQWITENESAHRRNRREKREISIYDYIGAHLGYRLIIRDVMWKKKKILEIYVENSGFAEMYEEMECLLELRPAEKDTATDIKSRWIDTGADTRMWKSGKTSVVTVAEELLWEMGRKKDQKKRNNNEETEVYLHLRRKRDGKPVLFANADAEHGVLLGVFR